MPATYLNDFFGGNRTLKKEIFKKIKSLFADRRPLKKRVLLAALPTFAAVFTFLFFGPLELVAFSSESLSYTYLDVLLPLSLLSVLAFLVGTGVLLLLRGKLFNIAVSSVTALTVCGYMQGAFLNGPLGTLTGEPVAWEDKAKVALLNLVLWVVVFALVYLVLYLHRKLWAYTLQGVCALLAVMQLAPTIAILTGSYSDIKINDIFSYTLTTDGMQEYSKKENVFLFVVDTLDLKFINEIKAKTPDFFEKLDGFTAYTDATSRYARTTPSLAHIMSGCDDNAFEKKRYYYYKECWESGAGVSALEAIKNCGYDIDLYSQMNYLFSHPDQLEYLSNDTEAKGDIKTSTLLAKLVQLSVYRYSPTVLKPFFIEDTKYFNDVYDASAVTPFVFNDSEYLSSLESADTVATKNSFKLYHFYGSHYPYTLDEKGNLSDKETTAEVQTRGVFTKLFAAFDRMKELGIYDDATIIITADHGEHPDYQKVLDHAINIGLFYKPSGSAGTPLAYSQAPVTTDNIIPTLVNACGGDGSVYGKALNEVAEDEIITRIHYCPIANENWVECAYTAFEIKGKASDFNNWKYLGTMDLVEPY